MALRVLLADDNALFREGMASLLARCSEEVQVVGQAKDAAEAVRKTSLLRPDVVLMDLSMPLGGGIEATRQILEERPDQAICMLTVSEQAGDLFTTIRAGARGYLVKDASREELTAMVTQALTDSVDRRVEGRGRPQTPGGAPTLTERETQVLRGMSRGRSNSEIGKELYLSEDTVKTHARRLFRKLGAADRAQAAAMGFRWGLVR